MPLADKIMELRKKQGWSQIDLADRLDVSRQSVSKWEMAQAVPELDKIIKMSELFAVTTDYLLKDDAPKPEPEPKPEPKPVTATPPEKPKRNIWKRVVLAAALFLAAIVAALLASGVAAEKKFVPAESKDSPSRVTITVGTPSPAPETVFLEDGAESTAVFDPDNVEDGMTEYVYEGESVTSGGFDEAAMAAAAAEYAPYGLTCDEEHHWYLDGVRIRNFTDVLTTNGESLTGGDFHGTLRNFCGDGFLDVRAVRDYDHCGDDGAGTLLYLESRDVRLDGDEWTEHHAGEHHHG